jgi:hypothetical protein
VYIVRLHELVFRLSLPARQRIAGGVRTAPAWSSRASCFCRSAGSFSSAVFSSATLLSNQARSRQAVMNRENVRAGTVVCEPSMSQPMPSRLKPGWEAALHKLRGAVNAPVYAKEPWIWSRTGSKRNSYHFMIFRLGCLLKRPRLYEVKGERTNWFCVGA